tara:strand:- start:394 stop:597 length:204 start_codon:yes stop_codon:yes gene_type:complete
MTWDYYNIEKEIIRRDTLEREVEYETYVKLLNETFDKMRMLPVPKTRAELQQRMRAFDKLLEEEGRN